MTASHNSVPGASDSPFPALSARARKFLDGPRFGIVATRNPDGSTLQAVVWYLIDGDEIVFNSRVGRQWPSNLERDRRVSICVADGYDYIELRGEVEIDTDPAVGQAVIAALARRYHPNHQKSEAQIAVFLTEQRVTFRLRPSRIYERVSD
jgi:PPOX class probable F420-dependent enzyme